MSMGFASACSPRKKPEEPEQLQETSVITDLSDERYTNLYGRTYYNDNMGGMTIVNSASGFEVRFRGTSLSMSIQANTTTATGYQKATFSVFVDGETDSEKNILSVRKSMGFYTTVPVAEGLAEGEHTVKVLKRTPSNRDQCYIQSLETDGTFLAAPERPALKLDFYGDSITCGEGVMREVTYNESTGTYEDSKIYTVETQNVFHSYAGFAAKELNAEFNVFGRGGIAMKYNYPTSEFSVLGNYKSMAVDLSLERGECPEYDYSRFTPDVVVIYLGTNDYARYLGGYAPDFPTGLVPAFIQFIREAIGGNYGYDIPIFLCSNQMAPNSGLDQRMEEVKTQLKSQFPNLETVRFEQCAAGHPVSSEGLAAGRTLAQAIREKLDLLA